MNGPRADGRRPGGSLDRIAGALLEGRAVRAFVDRVVSPSYVEDVAVATLALVRTAAPHGLYHCVGSGHATWLDVTRELAERLGVQPAIRGITLDELNLRAPRPRFCALSNRKLGAAGIEMPHWRDAVARYAGIRRRFSDPARSLRRRTLAARNGSPAHALSSVSGRLRRSAGRGGFSVVGEQRAKFGPRGPHGPPETAVRVDLPPWRAAFPASYAAISTCRRLTFNARHTRSHSQRTFASPRKLKRRKPSACLIQP